MSLHHTFTGRGYETERCGIIYNNRVFSCCGVVDFGSGLHGVRMRVLVACEYSGIVRDAFLECGHDAMSEQWG